MTGFELSKKLYFPSGIYQLSNTTCYDFWKLPLPTRYLLSALQKDLSLERQISQGCWIVWNKAAGSIA